MTPRCRSPPCWPAPLRTILMDLPRQTVWSWRSTSLRMTRVTPSSTTRPRGEGSKDKLTSSICQYGFTITQCGAMFESPGLYCREFESIMSPPISPLVYRAAYRRQRGVWKGCTLS
eukprot:9875714-Heterocapsa_arctica.AAC.1